MFRYTISTCLSLVFCTLLSAQHISHNVHDALLITIQLDTLEGKVAIDRANKQIQLQTGSKFRIYNFDEIHFLHLHNQKYGVDRCFQRYYNTKRIDDLLLEQMGSGPLYYLRKSESYLYGSYIEGKWIPDGNAANPNEYFLWTGADLMPLRKFKKQIFTLCNAQEKADLLDFAIQHNLNFHTPQHQLLIVDALNKIIEEKHTHLSGNASSVSVAYPN